MKRLALAGVVAALLLSVPTPGAAAPADWAGSQVTTAGDTDDQTPAITADLVRSYADTNPATRRLLASTAVTAPGGLPAGCASSLGATTIDRSGSTHRTSAELTTSCNGRYAITVTGTLQRRTCGVLGCGSWSTLDTHEVTGSVFIAAPPTSVTTVTTAPGDGRSVLVSWVPPPGAQPDLGYRVERISASGTTVTLADITDPTTTSYTDDAPPGEGGVTTYRVYTTRPGPGGTVDAAPGTATADVARDPAYVPPDPDDPTPTTTPGAGSGGGSGGPGGGSSRTNGRGAVRSTSPGVPSVRVPRVGSPSRSLFPPLLSPPVDSGFEGELPYEDREPGEAAAELPNDLAAGLADVAPGRGLAIPMATGLVLAVWAFHLRFLARVGRPQLEEADDAPELLTW